MIKDWIIHNNWVPIFLLPHLLSPNYVIQEDSTVNLLMHQHIGSWDVDLLQFVLPSFVVNAILQFLLLSREFEDKLV